MGDLPGDWYIGLSWEIHDDPAGDGAHVMMSSYSLNVDEATLTNGVRTNCLVRYDTNRLAGAPSIAHSSVHLNVLQPGGLLDKVHYPIFGLEHEYWPLDRVLPFFLSSDLQGDLVPLLS